MMPFVNFLKILNRFCINLSLLHKMAKTNIAVKNVLIHYSLLIHLDTKLIGGLLLKLFEKWVYIVRYEG